MDLRKVTIQIIGNDNEKLKSFDLSRNLITNYKKYLIYSGSVFMAAIMLFFSVFAYTVKLSFDKYNLSGDLSQANNRLEKYDSLQLSQKLNKIDNNISMIDSYLQQRGLLETGNAGGEKGSEKRGIISYEDKINHFENRSDIFLNTIKDIPLGYPYGGPRSSDYGYRRNPFGGVSGEFHPGIDLKGPYGDPVFATGDGVINRCDWYNGYGNAIIIDHKSGYQTLFGHLSGVNVVQGQQVKAGDVIGFIGSTGRSTGTHLHYEIRKNGDDIDPEPFLKVF